MLQILHVMFWNACLAAGLAVAIFLTQRIRYLRCQPNLWHALWLLVLLKLVTPPIFAIPVSVGSSGTEQFQEDHLAASLSIDGYADETLLTKTTEAILTPQFAVAMSALGTIALLLVSYSRVRSVGRLVRHAEPAPDWMQEAADMAARQLKLKRVPAIRTVNGIVAPFLWAARGPIVIVPCQLATTLGRESVRLIIKHELAHYARRDHWTNAFSMTLGTLLWWNPVVWLARRELRILQESCCDRMVLATDTSQRHRYAEAILKTVDFLASDDAAYSSPATAFASCSTFKRRLEMIVSETPNRWNSRTLLASMLLCAAVVLPVGMTFAQDYDAVERRLGEAVAEAELSLEQANAMMGALRRSTDHDAEARRMRVGAVRVKTGFIDVLEKDVDVLMKDLERKRIPVKTGFIDVLEKDVEIDVLEKDLERKRIPVKTGFIDVLEKDARDEEQIKKNEGVGHLTPEKRAERKAWKEMTPEERTAEMKKLREEYLKRLSPEKRAEKEKSHAEWAKKVEARKKEKLKKYDKNKNGKLDPEEVKAEAKDSVEEYLKKCSPEQRKAYWKRKALRDGRK